MLYESFFKFLDTHFYPLNLNLRRIFNQQFADTIMTRYDNLKFEK